MAGEGLLRSITSSLRPPSRNLGRRNLQYALKLV